MSGKLLNVEKIIINTLKITRNIEMFSKTCKNLTLLLYSSLIFSSIEGVFINLAYKRKTHASSGDGHLGVDGDLLTVWQSAKTETVDEWFVVDLAKHYKIYYVLIYHMCPHCNKRSTVGYVVGVAEKFHPVDLPPIRGLYRLCGREEVRGRWEEVEGDVMAVRLDCVSRQDVFRYVIVQRSIAELKKVLSFSELEVYADVPSRHIDNAFGKPAYMGSSTSQVFFKAPNCVDGDSTTTCRSRHSDSWFLVDLISEFVVKKVRYIPEIEYTDWDTTRCVVGLARHFLPKEQPPRRNEYDLCGYCPPGNLPKESVDVDCINSTLAYRYVLLQQYHAGSKNFIFADVEVYAVLVSNEMIGCYKLQHEDRSFRLHYVEDCVIKCREDQLPYSAVQDKHCHCLSSLPPMPPSPLHSCNVPCPREEATCGGTMHFHSVYRNYPEKLGEQMMLTAQSTDKRTFLVLLLVLLSVLMGAVLVVVLVLGPVGKYVREKWRLYKFIDDRNEST